MKMVRIPNKDKNSCKFSHLSIGKDLKCCKFATEYKGNGDLFL